MNKTVFVLALVLCVAPAAAYSSFFSAYTPVVDETSMSACIFPYLDGLDFGLSVSAAMDEPETITNRYCSYGIGMFVPYNRTLWVKNEIIDGLAAPTYNLADFLMSNYAEYTTVFEPTVPNTPSVNLARVEYVPGWTTDFVKKANEFLRYDITRANKFAMTEAPLFYSLARGSVHGGQFYDTLTSSFSPQSTFTSNGLAYPPQDLSNPSELVANGNPCGTYKCFSTAQTDVDVKNSAGSAFFAFDDSLNYYYYPYYVKTLDYVVKAYNGTDASKVEVYSREGSIAATSTDVFFPETTRPFINRQRIDDPFFDFGSKISYDGKIATLPSNAQSVTVAFNLVLYRNPLYRQRSPVDASWYASNLSSSSALLNVQGLNNVKLSWTRQMNVSNFVTNYTNPSNLDNSSPVNNFVTNPDDNTGPTIPTGTTTNSTGGSGIDWSRDPNSGGGLQGQYEYAEGLMTAQSKGGFFDGLQAITDAIFRLGLALALLFMLFVAVFAFFLMVPSSYRKLLDELKRLGGQKWG